ncbi:MAG: cation:proton antiporter [Acidobacteria bacterium]|nr:cation:proton antiporter [Acidobacteriota bacterium]
MNEPVDLIGKLVVLLAIACAVLFLLTRLRLPPVVGYLLSGVLLGPFGLRLITGSDAVATLAEIGVMLLMFTLGLEFDTGVFQRFKQVVLGGGSLQILLTLLCAVLAGPFLGWSPRTAFFLGCVVALSSTAVVLKSLMQQGLLDTLPGRLTVGILILQDLSVVPMMILLPIAGGSAAAIAGNLSLAVGRAALLLAVTFVLSRWVMPRVLNLIASGRSQELFLLATLTLCLGMAWLSHSLGVSYALGAFLAGLILGGSEYAHQMTADIVPFRDVFSGVFFVAMGMLMDPGYALANWPSVLVVVGLILVLKTAITTAAVGGFGYPLPVALQVGINLAQVGEFSFLIALMGVQSGLITRETYQVAIAASVISMIVAPVLTQKSAAIASYAGRLTGGILPAWSRLAEPYEGEGQEPHEPLSGHLVILGYGTLGRTLGEVLVTHQVPFVALEIDPTLVREARRAGHPVRYGDAGSDELLRRAGVDRARILAVTLPDHVMERAVIRRARRMNPGLHILARGRRGVEDEELYRDGADEVIHEGFEVGIEFLARILRRLNFPKQAVERQLGRLRSGRYEVFRREDFAPLPLGDVRRSLDALRVEFLEIPPESPLIGKSLRDAGVREATGALILAVVRDGRIITSPEAWFVLQEKDTILVSGAIEQVAEVETLLGGRAQ